MAKKLSKRPLRKKKGTVDIGTFLPMVPDVVKAIAMQGTTDDEMALMFGLSPKTVEAWRKYYPSFDKALEEGRTVADLKVIQALHQTAVGSIRKKDVLVKIRTGHGAGEFSEDVEIHTITEEIPPETNAIKMWLQNRDPKRWNRAARHVQLTGKENEPGIDVKNESKAELMSSILSLIQPKPDGV